MTYHVPVLLEETIDSLNIRPEGVYVDCTVGGGGHSLRIVEKLTTGRLIAIDQDEEALAEAKRKLADHLEKITFVHDNFRHLGAVLERTVGHPVDGILMDIGVSSHQLDEPGRGFSYHEEGVLDMRMDRSGKGGTARDIVNTYSEQELVRIFYQYGEERWAKRIAQFIVDERDAEPLETSFDLVRIIKKAIPKKVRLQDKHPARRVFQALRIEVNHELDVLEECLRQASDWLNPGGRLAVITFHSLEDRVVKNILRVLEEGPALPKNLPVRAIDQDTPMKRISRKPIVATEQELAKNPRARSAKLRVAERKPLKGAR